MSNNRGKKAAARHAVSYVKNGMTVGLGTGSTAYYAIERLSELVSERAIEFTAVATSVESQVLAQKFRIPLLTEFEKIDVTIDGADEIDGAGNLIKGGGGALTREKIVAHASAKEIIVVDDSKQVETLGKFPLAVEVLEFGWHSVIGRLEALGCKAVLRRTDQVFRTDNGNIIVDCHFGKIDNPAALVKAIDAIPGVIENGLFVGMTDLAIVGFEDGHIEEIPF